MSWLQALILGIVQGLTEFLPVSSSGHLEIAQALFGLQGCDNLFFDVIVHTATVCSTLVVLWAEVWSLLKGVLTTPKWNEEKVYASKILLSMIPIFIVGVFFKDKVEQFFGSGLLIVGVCLLLTSVLLLLSDWISQRRGTEGREIGWWDALIIGIAQAVAVLPGLSRSGSTIATGLLLGNKKTAVAQFSFLMVIIPILGNALLDGMKLLSGAEVATSLSWVAIVVGFVSAFLTGCFACRFMLRIVRQGRLWYFGLYCLIVGAIAIVYGLR